MREYSDFVESEEDPLKKEIWRRYGYLYLIKEEGKCLNSKII